MKHQERAWLAHLSETTCPYCLDDDTDEVAYAVWTFIHHMLEEKTSYTTLGPVSKAFLHACLWKNYNTRKPYFYDICQREGMRLQDDGIYSRKDVLGVKGVLVDFYFFVYVPFMVLTLENPRYIE